MRIVELTYEQFDDYAKEHILSNYQQSSLYALFMSEQGYGYDYIGYIDEKDNIHAASLILYKKINTFTKYGFAPKGFLIDYTNKQLLEMFTYNLIKYYHRKGFAFIKINPEIAIGEIHPRNNFQVIYNQNQVIEKTLEELGYIAFKKDKVFQNTNPTYNVLLPLKNFSIEKVFKPTRNKIRNAIKKGLVFEKARGEDLEILYEFIKRKKDHTLNYYKDLFISFNKKDAIDIFLVRTDYNTYIENIKLIYENELETNNFLASLVKEIPKESSLNRKMESDRTLAAYKEDLEDALKVAKSGNIYVAGAIVIKEQKRVNIFISGFDKNHQNLNANYFLHYCISNYYKDKYDFLDLNGISGDFNPESKYYGLNIFKIGFNPKIYEFIGEYDLVIDKFKYKHFISSPKLFQKYQKNNQL